MRELFDDIDLTAQRLLFLRDQGRQEEAVRLFREEIEESLDAELEDHDRRRDRRRGGGAAADRGRGPTSSSAG